MSTAMRNATDVATAMIREAIIEGRLAAGERLKEEQLAADLGISRTPVREALLVLAAEGLVDSMPNRGAAVRSYTIEQLIDLYDLRALLEGYAARRAATRADDDQLAELDASCERFKEMRDQKDLKGLTKENLAFHYGIVAAANMPKLSELVRTSVMLPLVYRSFNWYTGSETAQSDHAHRHILAALRAHDGERAELLMKEHVFTGRDILVQGVAEEIEAE